jgi:hypothetical protein
MGISSVMKGDSPAFLYAYSNIDLQKNHICYLPFLSLKHDYNRAHLQHGCLLRVTQHFRPFSYNYSYDPMPKYSITK